MVAIAAVPNYYALVLDYTIEPGGNAGNFVDQAFELHATAPVTVNGGASADLSTSPILIAASQFDASTGGIVPSPGVATTTFLRADGTWATEATFVGTTPGLVPGGSGNSAAVFLTGAGTWTAGTIVGVSSVTGTAPIVVTPTTGAAVVSASLGGILVGGIVPATGGHDPTKFLCATAPLTWAVPGTAGFVSLQSYPPGIEDVGSARVSKFFVADLGFVTGSTTTILSAFIGTTPGLYVVRDASVGGAHLALAQYSANGVGPTLQTFKARGTTESAPSGALDNDTLFTIVPRQYTSTGDWSGIENFSIQADGDATATYGSYVDLVGHVGAAIGNARLSSSGLRISQAAIADADRASSTLDVQGSFAAATALKTVATPITLGETDYSCLIDGSSTGDLDITLPTAVGCQGRRYRLQKVDTSDTVITLLTTGAEVISGIPSGYILLRGQGDAIEVVSDGSNWWIESHHLEGLRSHQSLTSIGSVANSVSQGFLQALKCWNILRPGSIVSHRGNGTFGATGAPTMRFRIDDGAANVMADSGFITMPDTGGVSSWFWSFDCALIYNTIVLGGSCNVRWLKCILRIQQTTLPDTFNTYEWGLAAPPAIGPGDQSFAPSFQWSVADPLNTITITSQAISLELGCLPL